MTTFGAASDGDFVKMTTFSFQWMRHRYAVSLRFQYSSIWRDGGVWPCFGGTALIQCGAVMIGSDSTVSLNTPHGSPGSQLHCVIFRWIPIRSLCCMPAGHGGWRSSLVLLPRCLWSRSRFDGPLWGRWPRIGWYLWVSDPGSAGMGHRCSSSCVGRHDDMSCRLSQVSLLFYCNIFSKYVYLCCVCQMGAYEHIHVHIDEILVWNWVSPGWLFP